MLDTCRSNVGEHVHGIPGILFREHQILNDPARASLETSSNSLTKAFDGRESD